MTSYLCATVGKLNTVFSVGGVTVAVLVVAEVGGSGVAVSLNSVSEFVCWGVDVFGLTVGGGWGVDRGGSVDWGRGVWGRGVWGGD